MSTVEWARPIVLQLDAYQKRSFGWNLAIVILMAALSSVYSFLVSPNIVVIFLIILFMGLISVMLKDTVLNPIDLSLPDVYCVSLVRIIDLSLELETGRTRGMHTQVQDRFYDALANLIKQIDTDLYQLRNNLAAWKTIVDLRLLRIYLLKFTTAATDPVSAAQAVGPRWRDGQLSNGHKPRGCDYYVRSLTDSDRFDFHAIPCSLPSLRYIGNLIRRCKGMASSETNPPYGYSHFLFLNNL